MRVLADIKVAEVRRHAITSADSALKEIGIAVNIWC
jgi:hypothetical protein